MLQCKRTNIKASVCIFGGLLLKIRMYELQSSFGITYLALVSISYVSKNT